MVKKRARLSKPEGKHPSKVEEPAVNPLPSVVLSDQLEPVAKKGRWTNKERVLIFSSRGIGFRDRHLMRDLRQLMPHSKADVKMQKAEKLLVINEIAEMKNCSKVLFFENRKHQDLYLWAANTPEGPSVKFLVENVHTMDELKMTGNCLKGSRPLLSFDKAFDTNVQYQLVKELLIQIFSTPLNHPKSQPFFDRVYTFSMTDHRIWFRHYQIVEEDGALAEIGPRFVLNPIKIFSGSFGGAVLYKNPYYTSPNAYRRMIRKAMANKYLGKLQTKEKIKERKENMGPAYKADVTDDIFLTIKPADNTKKA